LISGAAPNSASVLPIPQLRTALLRHLGEFVKRIPQLHMIIPDETDPVSSPM
jgi:hypothetical protein